MQKKLEEIMLIEADNEETRMALLSGSTIRELRYTNVTNEANKGNIYLGKISRVEPSLQAAFVDFGDKKHGFLPFNEIHPDYYLIPAEDREKIIKDLTHQSEIKRRNALVNLRKNYDIQQVIRKNQIVLVQIAKDSRGNKGSSMTTYITLPGRYCVFMPNNFSQGGISRKIQSSDARKHLQEVLNALNIPSGSAVILRTAGFEQSVKNIKQDYKYLYTLWNQIRTKTLESSAPALIHTEADLIVFAIRDYLTSETKKIYIQGDEAYKQAVNLIQLMSLKLNLKVIKHDKSDSLFKDFHIERKVAELADTNVTLESGGYLVIQSTEALVAIDVNSGKATQSRHIENTALQTNLEAAETIAQQIKLRNLSGLIIVDFIDMRESSNIQKVEQKMKESFMFDRAKIQIGKISQFGMLEMSRQRLQPSLFEMLTVTCPVCHGSGIVPNGDMMIQTILRALEEKLMASKNNVIHLYINTNFGIQLVNENIQFLADLENKYHKQIKFHFDSSCAPLQYSFTATQIRKRPVIAKKPKKISKTTFPTPKKKGFVERLMNVFN